MRLSIVIPVLDEARSIATTLERLQPARARGAEIVVVDGGSGDDTVRLAMPLADRVLTAPRGRATQMATGATTASGTAYLFLHADCAPPDDVDQQVLGALAGRSLGWGRFDVRLIGAPAMLGVIAWSMNLRSRLSGIATGDQGMFMTRAAYSAAGGFPAIALMEDIALSRALKRLCAPICLRGPILASGRRWERHGVWRTIVLMWRLRLAYFLGADPATLASRYERPAPQGRP